MEIYKNELAKDSEFEKYLTKLGEIYFDVKPKQTGGFFGNLLQQFLQESDDEEETSNKSPQPNQQPPGPVPFPPFSLFESICQPRGTHISRPTTQGQNNSSSSSQPQHEDLD